MGRSSCCIAGCLERSDGSRGFGEPLPEANIANAYEIMSRPLIAPLASVLCLALSACQTASGPPSLPSPDTASTAAAVPASSPAAPIRGVGLAPHLAGQSHWTIGQCTTNGAVKVCN
ncbi:putative lipoprotein [Burkholderia metallica]|nr:putative lipoprotein [Burkholderia metallica]